MRVDLFNPINLYKHKKFIAPLFHYYYIRLARKFKMLPKPQNPFLNRKVADEVIDFEIYTMIKNALQTKTPIMMGRYGFAECQAMQNHLLTKYKIQRFDSSIYSALCTNAGFFKQAEKDRNYSLKCFYDIMIKATKNCDVFGTWNGYLGFEEYFINTYAKEDVILTNLLFFGPNINASIPFTYALENTKVLVIHPFAQTIQSQYKHYDKLFDNKKVLPKFELQTFQAVQTMHQEIDNRFSSWFEALDWMTQEISQIDFDIALIGCGAYGFPLASNIKNMGKIAVHCGGNLQLLFGIKGKRWEIEQPEIGKALFNEYWVRPNHNETIKDNLKIEGGCYW